MYNNFIVTKEANFTTFTMSQVFTFKILLNRKRSINLWKKNNC